MIPLPARTREHGLKRSRQGHPNHIACACCGGDCATEEPTGTLDLFVFRPSTGLAGIVTNKFGALLGQFVIEEVAEIILIIAAFPCRRGTWQLYASLPHVFVVHGVLL